ncbi:MAG TPA: DNA starvation/stationary phase protection protein, partial [Alcanivorax sp.]|nr:DNA starvation/stationary phase protection protein [Alcanivorax sp.]HAI35997.1 DNA starvation/stationary phase protection protein [Alcanivorax sp.]HBT04926.1 DNA starvation/stationary phase protection protein [Alcanivorax sp.]HCJ63395.1 DNA starvation/stationary phase protection protein [Alcanivorax sp.]
MIEHSKEVSQELSKLLAESYTLYLKTHNYHWNVTGPMFHSLHLLFEQQYTELATAVDTIAERIRALGDKAPGSYAAFARLSSVKDAEGEPDATEMLKTLTADHRIVAERANKVLKLAAGHEDEGTAAIASERIEIH